MIRVPTRLPGGTRVHLKLRIDRRRPARDVEQNRGSRAETFRALARSALAGAARAGAIVAESAVTAFIVALFQNL
ncbi:hypothetical protein A8926_2240 [Saccharopolyspora spinosa]|uniref:Uncharacterized protein n=1 Tax=Saccharopolyspora spinosa TaxID=60894 RepID=A0A2N3XVH1_SACSN|nr:hypothetical protein A8926_2240 [Saccharopolyspora spinosa]